MDIFNMELIKDIGIILGILGTICGAVRLTIKKFMDFIESDKGDQLLSIIGRSFTKDLKEDFADMKEIFVTYDNRLYHIELDMQNVEKTLDVQQIKITEINRVLYRHEDDKEK